MPKKIFLRSCVATLTLTVMISAAPARAGFEWVAPNEGASYQSPALYVPPPAAPSAATSMPEIISPVIISGNPMPSSPSVPLSPSAPIAETAPTPITPPAPPANEPARPNLATATISVSAAPEGDVVQGFATQVPLALALRQVLPVGYNFSLDKDVGTDMLVSYKGGRPWRETLKDMIAPAGLVAREQGAGVAISRATPSVAPPLPAAKVVAVQPAYAPAPMMMAAAPRNELPAINIGSPDGWTAARGDTLRKVLTDWCRRAGVELQWLAEYDYPIEASAHFNGGFEEAVRMLLAGFDSARPQPVGELHANSGAGQKVLVVQARGNSYSN